MAHVPRAQSPVLRGNWSLTADVEILDEKTEGVIYAQGSFLDGISFFVQHGALGFAHATLGELTVGRSETTLPRGRITVGVEIERGNDDSGTVSLVTQGRKVASIGIQDISRMSKMRGVDVGRDPLATVTDLYQAPFEFTGVIHSVELHRSSEA